LTRKYGLAGTLLGYLAIGAICLGAVNACKSESSTGPQKAEPAAKAEQGSKAEGEGPKVVAGPGFMPECFAPWNKETKFLQWPARKPPFRIALVNGYVGNAWRIQ